MSKKLQMVKKKVKVTPLTEDERLAEEIVEKKNDYAGYRSPNQTEWEKILTYYELRAPERKYDWQSNAFLGILYRDTRIILPRIKKMVIGPMPLLNMVGKGTDEEEKYISYALRKCNGYLAMSDTLFDACLFGTGWGKLVWEKEYQKIMHKVPKITPGKDILKRVQALQAGQPETDEWEEIPETIQRINRPVYYYVPNLNIFANINETDNVDDAELVEVKFVDLPWLKARSKSQKINPLGYEDGLYDGVEQLLDFGNIAGFDDPQSPFRSVREESALVDKSQKFGICLYIYQGDFEYKNEFYRNGVITVAHAYSEKDTKNVVLRVMHCPRSDGRKSYVRAVYERVPGRLLGRGIGHQLLRTQEITNDFFRAQMDRDTLYLHRPIAYDVNRVDDPRLLQLRMGGMTPVLGDPSSILREYPLEPTNPGSWKVLDALSMYGMECSGATRNLAGTETASLNRTASGMISLMQAAGERIMDTARDMAEEFISGPDGIGAGIHRLIKDNLDKEQQFTYVNNKGQEEVLVIDPQKLGDEVDVYAPTIFERNDRQQQAQQILQLMQYVAGMIGQDNLLELCRTVWDYMEMPDGDKLFQPDQQSIPIDVVMAALQQMGVNPSMFGAVLNQMSQQQMAGGGKKGGAAGAPSGGSGPTGARPGPNPQKAVNQGNAGLPMPSAGPNTGS